MSNPATLFEEALALHGAGKLKKARKLYERVLKVAPRNASALHNLGLLLHQSGDLAEASEHLRRAVELAPGNATYLSNYGELLRQSGRPAAAVEILTGALQAVPGSLTILNNLALAHTDAGDLDRARELCRQALAIAPEFAPALNTLGNVERSNGNLERSLALLQQTVRLAPSEPMAHNNLGLTLQALGRLDQAIEAYRQALSLAGGFAEGHNNLANALFTLGATDEAIEHYRQALRLAPDMAGAWANLAFAYEARNRLDEAANAVKTALELKPGHPPARIVRGILAQRERRFDDAIDDLRGALAESDDPNFRAVGLQNLGFAFERQGRFDDAFQAFVASNRENARSGAFRGVTPAHARDLVARQRAWLAEQSRASWSEEAAGTGAQPLFLIGFPRSGTTLCENVLNAHPGALAMEERDVLTAIDMEIRSEGAAYPAVLGELTQERLDELRRQYWQQAERCVGETIGDRLFIDKYPLNIVRMLTASRLFPGARVIFLTRDPRDVCLSCFKQNFRPSSAMANFLSLDDTVAYYRDVMSLWLEERDVLPLQWLEVRYEDMVANLEGQARRMLAFAGLEWNEAVLEFAASARRRDVRTASYQQVVEPLYRNAVNAWVGYQAEFEPYREILEPFVRRFGYAPDADARSSRT